MEVIVTTSIVSKLVYFTYLRDVFTTYFYRGESSSIDPKYLRNTCGEYVKTTKRWRGPKSMGRCFLMGFMDGEFLVKKLQLITHYGSMGRTVYLPT